jgi:NADH-quinone oxidoreductase subunit M
MNMTEIFWTGQIGYPVLLMLQLLPLIMAVFIYFSSETKNLFAVTLTASLIQLAQTIYLYLNYNSRNAAMQFAEHLNIIGAFDYHAAVDGISVLMIILTAVISLMIALYIHIIPLKNRNKFLAVSFAVQAALMSQFVTLNLLWFTLASALYLSFVGIILWRWSTSAESDLAITRYFQFMTMGILLLLSGVFLLGWAYSDAHGVWSFDLIDLTKQPVSFEMQSIVFFLLFYGLAIRIPLFPLHGWLPLAAQHGTVAIAPIFLLGLKSGIYALVRFVFPLVPDAVMHWQQYVIAFAVTGIFYAALLALMQQNLRRLIAFAVVSHTSILIIGLFSLNHTAFQGGIMLSVNFGIAITGLLFTTGFIYRRTHTMSLDKLGGLFHQVPLLGITFFITGLSIIGMPGTPGFDSMHLILEASIHRFGALLTVAAAMGNVIAAGFLLWAFQRAFLTPATELKRQDVPIVKFQEKLLSLMIIGILLVVGFYSEPWMELIDHSLNSLSQLYSVVDH